MRQISQKLRIFEDITSKHGSCTEKAPCWPVFKGTGNIDCFGIWGLSKHNTSKTQLQETVFFKSNPKAVSQKYAFQRIVNRFETEGVKSKEILARCNSAS